MPGEPAWAAFAAVTLSLTVVLVALSVASRDAVDAAGDYLLVEVTASQAVAGGVVAAAAWLTRVPPTALGLGPTRRTIQVVLWGVALGAALVAANEAATAWVGSAASATLRETLAPRSAGQWAFLLLVALPVVAVSEELLFRGALVGALSMGFGVSPWLLAVASSALFGGAHSAQGRVGVAAGAVLGFALAAAFVVTGSLVGTVVAHYLVNAAEFVVHELTAD